MLLCDATAINQEIQEENLFLAKCKFSKLTEEVEEPEHTNNHGSYKDCQRSTLKKKWMLYS